ncbi:putative DNA base hypermodification protein [bacterium]|nr:putative DNA base hypermodification protein [bacterium]
MKNNPMDYVDMEVLSDFRFYLQKINEREGFKAGLTESYDPTPGIALDSEFALPNVSMDPRYSYIRQDIASANGLSTENKVLNALMTHIYGGDEVSRVFSGEVDRSRGFIDFERVAARDMSYIKQLRTNLSLAREHGYKQWVRWGIRVSVQSGGYKHVAQFGDEPSETSTVEWMSSWIADGTISKIIEANDFGEACQSFMGVRGIGPYLGLHSIAGLSPISEVRLCHTNDFVIAGPGAAFTIQKLFPGLRGWSPTDICYWLVENQDEVIPGYSFHEHWHQSGIYDKPQSKLFPLTAEIALCQFTSYLKARDSKRADALRRKPRPNVTELLTSIHQST